MVNPAGESKNEPLRLGFDRRLTLEFHGSRITTDAGLLGVAIMATLLPENAVNLGNVGYFTLLVNAHA